MTDTLALVPSGIDTYRQPVVFMHEDCHVCRSEGFAAQTRVRIDLRDRWIIATLNVVGRGAWLAVDQAALSVSAGAARIISTDTIPHPSNAIGISSVLAEALRSLATGLDLPVARTIRLNPNPSERISE